jgi:hypothetical protein
MKVESKNDGMTLFADDGFEIVTVTLGSSPNSSADFTIVDPTRTTNQLSIAIHITPEILKKRCFNDSGNTASVMSKGKGRVPVSWNKII